MIRLLEIKMFDCATGEQIYCSVTRLDLSLLPLLRKDGLPCKRILVAIQSFLRGVLSGRTLQINICLNSQCIDVKQDDLF